MVQLHVPRHQDAVQRHPRQPERQRGEQADVPMQVHEIPAVVPPAAPPLPLQEKAREIFQNGADQCRQEKGLHRLPGKFVEQEPEKEPPYPIYGQIGPLANTAVYELMLRDKVNCPFPQPSHKTQRKKEQDVKIKGPCFPILSHGTSMSRNGRKYFSSGGNCFSCNGNYLSSGGNYFPSGRISSPPSSVCPCGRSRSTVEAGFCPTRSAPPSFFLKMNTLLKT